MSIWDWVGQSAQHAHAEGGERAQLYPLHRRAMNLEKRDPEGAIALLEQGIALARRLREPWWEMFYEHWKLQITVFKQRDFTVSLPCAARCTVEARKSTFANFPQRVCLHEDLITCYSAIDPVGYAPLIRDALDYMDREIQPGVECRGCHYELRADFLSQISDPEALKAVFEFLRVCEEENDGFHYVFGCALLCRILFQYAPDEARRLVGDVAKDGEELARRLQMEDIIPDLLMWQAVAARWAENLEAGRFYRLANEARGRLPYPPRPGFFVAAFAYHGAQRDFEGALVVLNDELSTMHGKGEWHRECQRRVQKCGLLAAMGQDWQSEAALAREAARGLKDPARVERALTQIAAQHAPSAS